MSYRLFHAKSVGVRDHIFLFLETEENGDGLVFHVVGTILSGMIYEHKDRADPETLPEFIPGSKTLLGIVNDLTRMKTICEAVPPPAPQVKLNGRPIDPLKPLRRCGEWVDEVLSELRTQEVLQESNNGASSS